MYSYLFPCHLFEGNLYGRQNFSYLHNKVTSYPATTLRVIVPVVGETLMLTFFQKQILKDSLNLRVYSNMYIGC